MKDSANMKMAVTPVTPHYTMADTPG